MQLLIPVNEDEHVVCTDAKHQVHDKYLDLGHVRDAEDGTVQEEGARQRQHDLQDRRHRDEGAAGVDANIEKDEDDGADRPRQVAVDDAVHRERPERAVDVPHVEVGGVGRVTVRRLEQRNTLHRKVREQLLFDVGPKLAAVQRALLASRVLGAGEPLERAAQEDHGARARREAHGQRVGGHEESRLQPRRRCLHARHQLVVRGLKIGVREQRAVTSNRAVALPARHLRGYRVELTDDGQHCGCAAGAAGGEQAEIRVPRVAEDDVLDLAHLLHGNRGKHVAPS
mmetsp:Transcript_19213/g.67822  ORF Transcript_19213/g.67822 Transcript_19213/m.67822 type:complete len:284 (+) Transcript_19213:2851-3702(+)